MQPALPPELAAWRAARDQRLRGPEGWLTLIGLFWLQDGTQVLGSDPAATLRLPASAPPRLGTLSVEADQVTFTAAPGVPVESAGRPVDRIALLSDAAGGPTVLHQGPLTFFVIERDGRRALRVKDADSPLRQSFTGLDYYPYDSRWTIVGRLEPAPAGKTVPVPNVLGHVEPTPTQGDVVFEVDGREQRLTAIVEAGTDELFLVFGDATNGRETYGGGRFLYAARPGADGRVTLDFHRAYNPPCAFTVHATCPLPPKGNRLPVAILAGEKKYGKGHA